MASGTPHSGSAATAAKRRLRSAFAVNSVITGSFGPPCIRPSRAACGGGHMRGIVRRWNALSERWAVVSSPRYAGAPPGKVRRRLLCSCQNVQRRCQPQAFPVWWSGQLPWPSWASRPMLTCCGMPAAISLLMTATTPGRSRPISVIAIFRIPLAILRWHRNGSRNSFAIEVASRHPSGVTAQYDPMRP
jgi:hypothetical protein